MAPRGNVPIREIVYQLSPYQQDVIKQTFKNAPKTAAHFVQEKAVGVLTTAAIYFGAQWWTMNEMEKVKMEERY